MRLDVFACGDQGAIFWVAPAVAERNIWSAFVFRLVQMGPGICSGRAYRYDTCGEH